MVKCYKDNIFISVKLDTKKSKYYVATVFDVKQSKIDSYVRCKCYYQNVEKFRHGNVGIYAFLMVVFFFYNDVIFLRRYPVCEATSKKLSHS